MTPTGFQWDEAKNRSNIDKHGVDFRDAVLIFAKPTLDRIDDKRGYGEGRVNSIGDINGLLIVNVTQTDRDGQVRLISARRASRAERELYLIFSRNFPSS